MVKRRKYSLKSKQKYASKLRKSMTPAELELWSCLKKRRDFDFKPQQVIRGYIPDFVELSGTRLIIEVDGNHHKVNRDKDRVRSDNLARSGYKVLRFWNSEVLKDCNTVMMKILQVAYGRRRATARIPTRKRRTSTIHLTHNYQKDV